MNTPKPISWFYENLPEEQLIEDKFREIIKSNYSLSWFTPIDTPAIERLDTLLSKWWDDNEIYWVKRFKADNITEFDIWLRFDLTVPLARYVSMYKWNLNFPFKVQNIWKSWRWERPQKWRYREFYQADIDIIWDWYVPLFADVEILSTIYNTLKGLEFWNFIININNKKLLEWFLQSLKITKISEIIGVIDKKDKVKSIIPMLEDLFLNKEQINKILELLKFSDKKDWLENLLFFENIDNELLKEGILELKYIYNTLLKSWIKEEFLKINPAISRGLNYYTWLVFETFIVWKENMWSISSWWRYENLCSNFSKDSFPWVGWSIWLSRLLSVLKDIWLIEMDKKTTSMVLVLNTEEDLLLKNLEITNNLRKKWIKSELYLDSDAKFSKQLKYANNKKIPYVLIYWNEEAKKWVVKLKILSSWEQKEIKIEDITSYIENILKK